MTEVQNSALLKTQDVVGKPVISLDGEELGSVSRVIVDPAKGEVAGLTVGAKGWFKGEKGVEFEAVKSFGSYAVTVEQSGRVMPLDNLPPLEKLTQDHNIYNRRIISPDGKLIGSIDDFYFNTGTGQIERYILTGGVIKNLFKGRASIPASSIASIGKDVIIAISSVEETIQKEETGLQDNLGQWREEWKEDLEHWKDDFEKLWEKTRNKSAELYKTAGGKIGEAAHTGKGKSKEILSRTGKIVAEKQEQLKDAYEMWLGRLQAIKTKPETPLGDGEIEALLGLKAAKTVTAGDGAVIIEANTEVSREIIEKAQKAGKIKELLISVATKDLEDKMESLEKEAQREDDTDI